MLWVWSIPCTWYNIIRWILSVTSDRSVLFSTNIIYIYDCVVNVTLQNINEWGFLCSDNMNGSTSPTLLYSYAKIFYNHLWGCFRYNLILQDAKMIYDCLWYFDYYAICCLSNLLSHNIGMHMVSILRIYNRKSLKIPKG
jgi:hypothetical protein